MKLAPLLAAMSEDELDRLALEHVRTDEKLARPQLCNFLEGALRSYRFIHDFLVNRQPPTFALMTLLLDAPGFQLSRSGFQELVMAETRRLAGLIDSGELLVRDEQLRIYRRALYEARRNDLDLNLSEAAVLGVLRQEMEIAQVEHFLIEHHRDLREFWDREDCFHHEETALLSAGMIFINDDFVLVPEETVPAIWQTLGIDMPSDSARRLYGHLSGAELSDALEAAGSRTSGSKEVRLERLIVERVQPRTVLRSVSLSSLKEICRETDATIKGNKDDLIERIIGHFAQRKDQIEEPPEEPPREEPRRLALHQFETLFNALIGQEIGDILRRFPDLRQTGAKDLRIRTLWDAHLSEHTLLSELMNRDLENVLYRLSLKLSGSKDDRIERIVSHFETAPPSVPHSPPTDSAEATHVDTKPPPANPEVLSNQELFRQKASNPSASLQPWLDHLLDASGLLRCYATEDPNPTKQLKNKLSQAAAARDGLLVLLLVDEDSFVKAKEALVERWLSNAEWPKSVASVALAYPLAAPTIRSIIQRYESKWGDRVRRTLFPDAHVHNLSSSTNGLGVTGPRQCNTCSAVSPAQAKYCAECGALLGDPATSGNLEHHELKGTESSGG